MIQQHTDNPQSSRSAAGAPRLSNGWVRPVKNRKHTRDASVPVKVRAKFSVLSRPLHTTLLDLVRAVNEVTDDEQLVVAAIAHLMNTHRVRLTGTFKNTAIVIV